MCHCRNHERYQEARLRELYLGDAWNVLLGHSASLDLRTELEARAGLAGLEADGHLSKLAGPAALLLVRILDVGRRADGLPVVHLGAPTSQSTCSVSVGVESGHRQSLPPHTVWHEKGGDNSADACSAP